MMKGLLGNLHTLNPCYSGVTEEPSRNSGNDISSIRGRGPVIMVVIPIAAYTTCETCRSLLIPCNARIMKLHHRMYDENSL